MAGGQEDPGTASVLVMSAQLQQFLRSAALLTLLVACSGPLESGPTCNNTDSTVSCCLKQNPGQYERCGAEGTPRPHMLGQRGAQFPSKTLWRGERGARLDVENPDPGGRPGQIHLQIDQKKYLYDPDTGLFRDAPRSIQKMLDDPRRQDAIRKALRYLGES